MLLILPPRHIWCRLLTTEWHVGELNYIPTTLHIKNKISHYELNVFLVTFKYREAYKHIYIQN